MVPVPVTPDNCFDVAVGARDCVRLKDLANGVVNVDLVA